jgi:hypothetical protein
MNFSEEVVRAQPTFLLSLLLSRHLDPHLRAKSGAGPWQVRSVTLHLFYMY